MLPDLAFDFGIVHARKVGEDEELERGRHCGPLCRELLSMSSAMWACLRSPTEYCIDLGHIATVCN